jgi:hypothetical protein
LLLISLVVYLRRRYSPLFGNSVGISLVLLLLAQIDWIYAGGSSLKVLGLVVVGLVVVWGGYLWENGVAPKLLRHQTVTDGIKATGVVAIIGFFIIAMFPAEVVGDNGVTNIIGHAAGLLWGAVIAAVICLRPPAEPDGS